jgi:hypothetical protein
MPELIRSAYDEPNATRVVIVREGGPRSVRHADEPSRFGARVGFWSAIGLGAITFLWCSGHLGEVAFARAIGLPELVPSDDRGFASGVRMVLAVPMRIYEMTLAQPMALAAAFVLIAVPAGGLAVAAPKIPGAPPPSKLAATFAHLGLVASAAVFAILIAWFAWPSRSDALATAPLNAGFRAWLDGATIVAGLDALGFAAAVLWLVLLFRMPLAKPIIGGVAVAGFIAAFAGWASFAGSNGVAAGMRSERAVVSAADDPGTERLLLGTVGGGRATLALGEPVSLIVSDDVRLSVVGRGSVVGRMAAGGGDGGGRRR